MDFFHEKYKNASKPIVVVSKCLGFEACRYNGQTENNKFIDKLKGFVQFIPVCPEVEVGLGTPRSPIRLVQEKEDSDILLFQPSSGKELSGFMMEFSNEFLGNLNAVDGFILKNRSPSCGIKEVKIYKGIEKGSASVKGKGLFGGLVKNRFPYAAVEDDGRLKNYKIREHFLTKLFLLRDFRDVRARKSIDELIKFHRDNKLLLMAYNQKQLKELGKIVGSNGKEEVDKVFEEYEKGLGLALARAPRYTSNINVLMRAMGYFSDQLSHREKEFILETIQKYRDGRVPFSAPLYVIKTNIVRFDKENLMHQTFFEPFPSELTDISDSGKGRD